MRRRGRGLEITESVRPMGERNKHGIGGIFGDPTDVFHIILIGVAMPIDFPKRMIGRVVQEGVGQVPRFRSTGLGVADESMRREGLNRLLMKYAQRFTIGDDFLELSQQLFRRDTSRDKVWAWISHGVETKTALWGRRWVFAESQPLGAFRWWRGIGCGEEHHL